MASKYKSNKSIGKGWFYESTRHRLARMGIKTGTKSKERLSPLFMTPIPYVPMVVGISHGSKELLERRAKNTRVISELKRHGWKIKELKYSLMPGTLEVYKGKNFLELQPTHWKKYKITKVSIRDEDEIDRLTRLFRKPYPYKIPEYSKVSTEEKIHDILYNPNKEQRDKELLTIEIPRKKFKYINFLDAYTKFNTQGIWKRIRDNNVQIEVEFKDSKDERYGNNLISLFNKLNNEKIKEKTLYVRTEPIEESSLLGETI